MPAHVHITPPPLNNHSAGFSLIELAIVLVIIGLLTGGVLLGKNLIRNADLQTVITDFSRYKVAANQFKDKYMALPGDFSEATTLWGKDNAACSGHTGTAATPGTCNGDGNGQLAYTLSAGVTAEIFQFWKQLHLEGLIQGNFSGLSGAGRYDEAIANINAPAAHLANNAVWSITYFSIANTSAWRSNGDYGNALFMGGQVSAGWPYAAILTSREAHAIDSKADDGHASKGEIWAVGFKLCTLADDATGTETDYLDYDLQRNDTVCALAFRHVIQ